MSSKNAFLSELEDALANGPADRRAKTLRRVTDLFVFGSSHFSGDHVALFEACSIISFRILYLPRGQRSRTVLNRYRTRRPASSARSPSTMPSMSPVRFSPTPCRSKCGTGRECSNQSQDHLLAISQRSSLVETVTDVLVERGNRDVALSTARNSGAKFSETGYIRLVQRSEQDDELAKSVGARPEIPRQYFLKLLTTASMTVRLALQSAHPEHAGDVQSLVGDIAAAIQATAATASRDYAAAQAMVQGMWDAGQLDESNVEGFARAGKFEETAAALAIMGALPIDMVERAMVADREEAILLVIKAIGLSWPAARSVLYLCAGKGGLAADTLAKCRAIYYNMKRETAAQVIKYQRDRK